MSYFIQLYIYSGTDAKQRLKYLPFSSILRWKIVAVKLILHRNKKVKWSKIKNLDARFCLFGCSVVLITFKIASQRARKALFTCVVINWIYYTEFVIEHTAPLCELILTWKFRFFLSGRQLLWMHRGIWSLHVYMVLILWFF